MNPWYAPPPWAIDGRAWDRAVREVAEATGDLETLAWLRAADQLAHAGRAFAALGVSADECASAFRAFSVCGLNDPADTPV